MVEKSINKNPISTRKKSTDSTIIVSKRRSMKKSLKKVTSQQNILLEGSIMSEPISNSTYMSYTHK